MPNGTHRGEVGARLGEVERGHARLAAYGLARGEVRCEEIGECEQFLTSDMYRAVVGSSEEPR